MEGKGAVQEIRSCFSNTSFGNRFDDRIWLQGNWGTGVGEVGREKGQCMLLKYSAGGRI